MLQSINELYGKSLWASDGEIGQVKDFYFDDHNWAVRYVVADTGSWLTGRQVLLSPHAFGSLHQSEKGLAVNLTLKQIENSPPIDLHKPVSRQHEEEYYQYYGWPYYWQGEGLWGMNGLSMMGMPAAPLANEPVVSRGSHPKRADLHLRCTQAVNGYQIQASDGVIGHVSDFIMNSQSWAIRQLIIKPGHLLSIKEMRIPTSKVGRISYEESTVFVNLTKRAIEQNTAHFHSCR